MRIVTAFWLVCATACAASSTPPPAASLPVVNVESDVVVVPADVCPEYAGWLAMTTDAFIRDELQRIKAATEQRLALERCNGATRLAQQRQKQAEDASAQSAWLSKWGFPLGLGAGVASVLAVFGVVLMATGGIR